MELSTLIQNCNSNWKISKNQILYHKYIDIPIASLQEDGSIFVFFDMCIFKQVNKIITRLQKLNIEFYLIDPLFSNRKKYDDDFVRYFNILNYIYGYSNPEFFDYFQKTNFDLLENLTRYMQKYDCLHLLDDAYKHVKKDMLTEYNAYVGWNWTTNINAIERADIREEIRGIDRQIKLNLII
jgi:hypothetical protein